jgi:hypothetical protein
MIDKQYYILHYYYKIKKKAFPIPFPHQPNAIHIKTISCSNSSAAYSSFKEDYGR